MREVIVALLVVTGSGCRINEHIAAGPVDGGGEADAAETGDASNAADAASCAPGTDTDGDNIDDCVEVADDNPFTDPQTFNGLHAIIGDRPEGSGNCSALDDFAEMEGRFDTPAREQDVYAGWEFDTSADSYNDASYGFAPNWDDAQSGRFSVRYRGTIDLPDGNHCVSVDIGATGTGIIDGRNGCGQIYMAKSTNAVAETGYGADSNATTGCFEVTGGAGAQIDIVFWYFNIFEQAILRVRHCAGTDCTPNDPLLRTALQAL